MAGSPFSDKAHRFSQDSSTMIRNRKKGVALNPAIVLGMSGNGLAVARALGEQGVRVIGVDHDPRMPGMYSRYLFRKAVCPRPDSPRLLNFLTSIGKEFPAKCVIFSTADEYLVPLSEARDQLLEQFIYLLPSREIVSCLLDKAATAIFAKEHGLPHPRTEVVSTIDELDAAIEKVGLPCFFKPIISHEWSRSQNVKGFEAQTVEQCHEFFRKIQSTRHKILLQEVVPGGDGNIYEYMIYCDRESKVLAHFTLRKIRQYPPHFGIACLSESLFIENVINFGEKLIKATKYHGLGHFEFKLDSRTKELVFLEANLRTSFPGQLSIAAGVNLPWIAYIDMVTNQAPQRPPRQRNGIRLLNLTLDVGHYMRARAMREITLGGWLREFCTLKLAHTYWRWNDPLPWVKVYSDFIWMIFRRILSLIYWRLKQISTQK
jgi:D-aspartate ligase